VQWFFPKAGISDDIHYYCGFVYRVDAFSVCALIWVKSGVLFEDLLEAALRAIL
jgi:hypothetical protein